MTDRPQPDSPAFVHPKASGDERRLLHDLKRMATTRKGRWAIQIHLSRLSVENQTEYNLRATEQTFSALVVRQQLRPYWLTNNDLVLMFDVLNGDAVRAGLVKLRFLFSTDPLLASLPSQGTASDAFTTWYPLERDYDGLFSQIQQRVAKQEPVHGRMAQTAAVPDEDSGRRLAPLTPELLGRVENALLGADLSSHIRRQPVCALVGKARPDPVFTEVFVSIADLRETMLPHVNLASNPWLFQHLTQTLDRRVLAMLTRRDDRTLHHGFSINLNVNTILSEDFMRFDDNLSSGMHGTIVLELRSEDIYADLSAFFFARDFVRQRGYRICIDGLTWQTLPYVDPRPLGVDLMKMAWQDDLPTVLRGQEGQQTLAAIAQAGNGRMILSRCDSEAALRFGQDVGITLFQGRYLDQITRTSFFY